MASLQPKREPSKKAVYRSLVTGRLVTRKMSSAQAKTVVTEIQRVRDKNKSLGY